MKRFILFGLFLCLSLSAYCSPLTGSGSGIGANTIDNWNILYKTLPNDSLAKHLQRRVHRAYSKARGFNIWTFTETQFLNQIRQRTNPVAAAPTELAAWDSLYMNVPTEELVYYVLQPVHEYYASRKGWQVIAPNEAAFIERLKTLLKE